MPALIVKLDRRAEVFADLVAELREMAASVRGLEVDLVTGEEFERARDEGRFRDFVEVASVTHEEADVLSWVREELVDEFGWLVDTAAG